MSNNKTQSIDTTLEKMYEQYKTCMKKSYNWSPDIGVFTSVIKWLVNSDALLELSVITINEKTKVVKKNDDGKQAGKDSRKNTSKDSRRK